MSAPGQRRSYLPRAAFGQPAPQSIGALRDANGKLIPTNPNATTQGPREGLASQPHDWSAFDAAFPKSNSAAQDRVGPTQPSNDFTSLPVGGSRVIADVPGKGAPTIDPKTPIQSQAMEIDPRYRTPGASPVARITANASAPTGPGRIVDETGDRTADFTAVGKLSSAPLPAPKRMSLTADQAKALTQAYPQLKDPNHADSVAFRGAFAQQFDPNKPMSTDDVMNIAHGLFQQRDMAKNGPSITNTNFGTPNLAQPQQPFTTAGGTTIAKPNIAPYDPQPLSTGNVTMNGAQPQAQVGGITFNQPQMPSNVTGPGAAQMAGPIKATPPSTPQPGLIDKAIDTVKSWMPTPAPVANTDADKQRLLTQPLGTFGF